MQVPNINPNAPDWARRLLKIPEWATIVGQDKATVYRKIDAKIYPPIIRIRGSARLAGWEAWECLKKLMAARATEAA